MTKWGGFGKYYILDGHKPVSVKTVLEWARWFEEIGEGRRVAFTDINETDHVSTVFLGLDHNFDGVGPPLLFETMIFGGREHGWMRRAATWEEAERLHAVAVEIAMGRVRMLN